MGIRSTKPASHFSSLSITHIRRFEGVGRDPTETDWIRQGEGEGEEEGEPNSRSCEIYISRNSCQGEREGGREGAVSRVRGVRVSEGNVQNTAPSNSYVALQILEGNGASIPIAKELW